MHMQEAKIPREAVTAMAAQYFLDPRTIVSVARLGVAGRKPSAARRRAARALAEFGYAVPGPLPNHTP